MEMTDVREGNVSILTKQINYFTITSHISEIDNSYRVSIVRKTSSKVILHSSQNAGEFSRQPRKNIYVDI